MNFTLPLLLIFLMSKCFVLATATDANGSAKTYGQIMDSLLHKERIVFDISSTPGDPKREESHNKSGTRRSRIVYYGPEPIYLNRSDPPGADDPYAAKTYEYLRVNPLQLYFLLDDHANSTPPPSTEALLPCHNNVDGDLDEPQQCTVILDIHGWNSSLDLAFVIRTLSTIVKLNYANTKVGLELDGRTFKANDQLTGIISYLVDVVIINIHLPPEEFLLSYSRFKRNLGNLLEDNYSFNPRTLANCTIYVKLKFQSDPENYQSRPTLKMTQELYHKYYFYLLQFSVFWLNEGGDYNLILPTFETALESTTGLDGGSWRSLVQADISPLMYVIPEYIEGVCAMSAILEQVSHEFENISLGYQHFYRITPKCTLSNGLNLGCDGGVANQSCYGNLPTSNPSTLSSISLMYTFRRRNDFKDLVIPTIKTGFHGLPWKVLEVLMVDQVHNDSGFESKVRQLPPNVEVACGNPCSDHHLHMEHNMLEDYPLVYPIYKNDSSCGPIWDQTGVIIWFIQFPDHSDDHHLYDFVMGLETFRIKYEEFREENPNKVVIIDTDFDFSIDVDSSPTSRSLYCHPANLRRFELIESFINFARFYNIPVKIPHILGDNNVDGGWGLLEPMTDVFLGEDMYPFFVARNYPEKFLLGDFHTDPCISWTREVPHNGIKIDYEYSGTTLYMGDLRGVSGPLKKNELGNLLLFALYKFSLVEVIANDTSDVETLLEVLSDVELIGKLVNERKQTWKIYIGLDSSNFKATLHFDLLLEKLLQVPLRPAGIHVRNWEETLALDQLEGLISRGYLTGISMEDCVADAMNGFENLKNFFSWHIAPVKYILCNIEPLTKATNVDTLETEIYLDTTLYIRKYFQKMFAKESKTIEILFRLNTMPIKPGLRELEVGDRGQAATLNTTAEFLTFFADVSQYSTAYKMRFFMVPAFDDSLGRRWGWWRISNFSRLDDTSVLIEREAEFLAQETWRPASPVPGTTPGWIKFLLSGIATICILLIGGIILLGIWFRRHYSLLPKQVVDSFLYGNDNAPGVFESRNFPNEFEIPRNCFVLLNLIGQGNFGLVYKAHLTVKGGLVHVENMLVALKIPRPDCSKESFKSMLSELKVLAHIGSHTHVVEFVGAYTKEIGRGIVKIATQFCENGALQEYLRTLYLQFSDPDEEGSKLARLKLALYRFAYEIALGMEFISSKKVVHGDLSTRNVLLDSDMVCKIADFGLSKKPYDYQTFMENPDGPLNLPWRWLAIESLQILQFSSKSDVWSYGVTLWEIFSLGCVPYPEQSYNGDFVGRLENGFRLARPPFSTEAIYEEMRLCWEINPEQRPGFTELAQFFQTTRDTDYARVVTS